MLASCCYDIVHRVDTVLRYLFTSSMSTDRPDRGLHSAESTPLASTLMFFQSVQEVTVEFESSPLFAMKEDFLAK